MPESCMLQGHGIRGNSSTFFGEYVASSIVRAQYRGWRRFVHSLASMSCPALSMNLMQKPVFPTFFNEYSLEQGGPFRGVAAAACTVEI
jgi:hypothetical protein